MKLRQVLLLGALGLASSFAQAERSQGWDYGADIIYQDSKDIDFDHGSSTSLDDDIGVALYFGYRFTERLELGFSLDWNTVDYDISVADGNRPGSAFNATGELESFTPRLGVNFNFLKGDFTPYVTGGVGWAFIDTNIPTEPPQTSCWYDPWWGYYCGTWQNTRSIDELTYNVGAGIRWDIGDVFTLRFGYERHWLELSEANGTPGLDRIKLGVAARY